MNKRNTFFAGLLGIVFSLVCFSGSASAATIDQKILAYDIWRCYAGPGSAIEARVSEESLKENGINAVIKTRQSIPASPYRGNLQEITCQELFVGHPRGMNSSYYNGLLQQSSPGKLKESLSGSDMEKMGYKYEPTGSCVWVNFTRTGDQNHSGAETLSAGRICSDDNNPKNAYVASTSDDPMGLSVSKNGANLIISSSYLTDINGNKSITLDSVLDQVSSMEDLRTQLISALGVFDGRQGVSSSGYRYSIAHSNKTGMKTNGSYVLNGNVNDAALQAANDLTDSSFTEASDYSPMSPNEAYALYHHYLSTFYGATGDNLKCDYPESEVGFYENSSEWHNGPMVQGGEIKTCYFRISKNSGKKVNALNGSLVYDGTQKDALQILEQLNGLRDQLSVDGINGADNKTPNSAEDFDACQNAGVVGVSWLICPTLKNMEYTASNLDKMVDDMLVIQNNQYDFDSPTYTVWEIMRNIANVLMVIVLLVIIFSQLTGFGIDNYGIKKMLPRLIIMALLINLSYVICVLAVDLSNLLGVGLRNLFGSIGNSLSYGESGGFIETIVASIFALAGVAGSGAGTAVAVGFSSMTVWVLLLSLLVVVFAVLLFFVSLGARMLIVILCLATSPIAFASFVLPNTQWLFKKWLKLFQAALVIFPICGALGGISIFVKGIALRSDQFWMKIIGLLAPYLQFFALPSLLRNSMSALGSVGTAMAGFGNAVMKGARNAQGAIQNSERFKEAQTWAAREHSARTSANIARRIRNRAGGENKMSAKDWVRYTKHMERANRLEEDKLKAFKVGFSDMQPGDLKDRVIDALNDTSSPDSGLIASAAMATLVGKGGIDMAMESLGKVNIAGMPETKKRQVIDSLYGSNVGILGGYAKYLNTGGKADFSTWTNGGLSNETSSDGIKNLSLADYIKTNGSTALNNANKDEVKYVGDKILTSGAHSISRKEFGQVMANAAVYSNDAQAKAKANEAIAEMLGNGTVSLDDLGVNGNMIGKMDEGFLDSVTKGHEAYLKNNGVNELQLKQEAARQIKLSFNDAINDVKNDPTILAGASNDVRRKLDF